jgi:hypothetical protein
MAIGNAQHVEGLVEHVTSRPGDRTAFGCRGGGGAFDRLAGGLVGTATDQHAEQ